MLSEGVIMEIFSAAMMTGLKVAAPVLVVSVLVGLVIAIFQAATQIHEQTLTFVPKLVAIALVMLLTGTWMIEELRDLMRMVYQMIAIYG